MAKTFGKRGVVPVVAATTVAPVSSAPALSAAPVFDLPQQTELLARVPILTIGLLVLLGAIFAFEVQFAFHRSPDAKLDLDTLLAFGAASRNRVIGDGEWWRFFLAPLLHSSNSHLIGNSTALLLVGFRLEALVGRGWYALVFALGGLGGLTVSLLANPPGMATVGASGAITALTAAIFVLSWHGEASYDAKKMRRVALFFGAPALLPLLVGHGHANVDYHAHLGGGLIGAALGFVLLLVWQDGRSRPAYDGIAGLAAFAMLGASVASAGAIVSHFSIYSAHAARFASSEDLEATAKDKTKQPGALVESHPLDPRTHLLNALALERARNRAGAEEEARKALALIENDPERNFITLKSKAQLVLGIVLAEQGRRAEASDAFRDICRGGADDEKATARKLRLCS